MRLLFLTALVSGALILSVGCGESKSGEAEAKADAAPAEEQTTDQSADGVPDQTQAEEKTRPKAPPARAGETKATDPKATEPGTVEIPSGMNLVIELQETIETGQVESGDNFSATLAEAVVVSDVTVFAAGSPVTGLIEKAVASGRLKTDAELALRILEIDGVPISSDIIEERAASHADRNKKLIDGGAIVGGIIGAIKGKNVKGAIVGAAAGAAAGTGAAVLTGKKNLKYESGTIMLFTLAEPVRVEIEK